MAVDGTYKENDRLLAIIGFGILIFCIAAFGAKLVFEPERLARYTWPVIWHGLFMLGWLALFPAQAWLMAAGRGRLHKHMGRLSVILAIAMIVTSLQVAIALTLEFQNAMLLAFNATVVISFVGFYAFAIFAASAGHTGLHRRLMLFTTLSIIGPAIGRVFDVLDMSEALSLPVILALKIIIPVIYDLGASGLRRLTMILIGLSVLDTLIGTWLAFTFAEPLFHALLLSN
ncbi:MAG: hypothetical protein HRT81_12295 [Henriciella sp.]|nr:hypothetical protein [Henriciella sp.]